MENHNHKANIQITFQIQIKKCFILKIYEFQENFKQHKIKRIII